MSYEIIYDKQFLKTKDNKLFVPMILAGSNNCYEATSRKRARSWFVWASTDKLLYTKEELLAYVEGIKNNILNRHNSYYERPSEEEVKKNFGYYTSISVNGHWHTTTFGKVKSVFNAGCDKALTIEELNSEGIDVFVRNTYYTQSKQDELGIEPYSRIIKNDDELFEAIDECNKRFLGTDIKATIEFFGITEDMVKWIRKRRFAKEKKKKEVVVVDEYYTITIDGRYLAKHTRNGYKYAFAPYIKLMNKTDAERKAKEFTKKYGRDYSVELVNQKTQVMV
jgi:hypothetical protein